MTQDKRTPLHYACEWGNSEVLNELLKRDASKAFLNAQDINGDTALHTAHRHDNKDSAKTLRAFQASKKITNQVSNG